MLVTKTTDGSNLIVLGHKALVGNVYIDVIHSYSKAWESIIGETRIAELHDMINANPDSWGDSEQDWSAAATHKNESVRILLAQHAKHLDYLKNDSSALVREAVVKACFEKLNYGMGDNAEYYQGIIEHLYDNCFNDEGIMVACAIASKADEYRLDFIEKDLMQGLMSHPCYIVRENVARHTTDSDILEALSLDADTFVRMQVARNDKTTRSVLKRLIDDVELCVRSSALLT